MNVDLTPRKCIDCPEFFVPSSNRQLRCPTCKSIEKKVRLKKYHRDTYVRKGYNQKGKNNNSYKSGIGTYKATRKSECEFCGDTRLLCVHHIDENRYNNELDNLATLCRSCHVLVHSPLRDSHGKFISKV